MRESRYYPKQIHNFPIWHHHISEFPGGNCMFKIKQKNLITDMYTPLNLQKTFDILMFSGGI